MAQDMSTQRLATGAWQVSTVVSNGHTTWLESRTYYFMKEKEAVARYYNTIEGMGWWEA